MNSSWFEPSERGGVREHRIVSAPYLATSRQRAAASEFEAMTYAWAFWGINVLYCSVLTLHTFRPTA